jgi:type IV secretion system protein VirB9
MSSWLVTQAAAAALAVAQMQFPLVPADPRIQAVPYVPDQVVGLSVESGYAAVVELSADERVENVVVGDSASWQVTANRRGDRLVVKPLGQAGATNMVVVTDQRRYVFLLQPDGGGPAPFVLKFTYPPLVPAEAVEAVAVGAEYRFRGTRALFPIAMSDDGRRTIVTWGRDVALPAIFAVDASGREGLVNGRMADGGYVIEGTAAAYVFRLGKARATALRRVPRIGR